MKFKVLDVIFIMAAAIIIAFGFISCKADKTPGDSAGGEAPAKEYVSKAGTFSITVPGEWTVSDSGNDEHIVLDNSDQSFSVLVQRFPKETAGAADFNRFVAFYKDNAIKAIVEASKDIKTEAVNIEGMIKTSAEIYEVSQNGTTAKAFVAFAESPKAYYVYTLTGVESVYDKEIEAQKAAISGLKEK